MNEVLTGKYGKHWSHHQDMVDETWWEMQISLFMWGGYWMHENELWFTLPLWVRRK